MKLSKLLYILASLMALFALRILFDVYKSLYFDARFVYGFIHGISVWILGGISFFLLRLAEKEYNKERKL